MKSDQSGPQALPGFPWNRGLGDARQSDDVQALRQAILEDAGGEAEQILADAQQQAESTRSQAEAQANAERDVVLQRARQEVENLRSQAVAMAQIEAQTLKLRRREQLLERVFADARQRLASAPQWPDYEQIVRRLIREAMEHLGADEAVVRADPQTRQVLGDEALAELGNELGVRLSAGALLERGTGIVLETADGHRRYDNTLETRLARTQDTLRSSVYRILTGETA